MIGSLERCKSAPKSHEARFVCASWVSCPRSPNVERRGGKIYIYSIIKASGILRHATALARGSMVAIVAMISSIAQRVDMSGIRNLASIVAAFGVAKHEEVWTHRHLRRITHREKEEFRLCVMDDSGNTAVVEAMASRGQERSQVCINVASAPTRVRHTKQASKATGSGSGRGREPRGEGNKEPTTPYRRRGVYQRVSQKGRAGVRQNRRL